MMAPLGSASTVYNPGAVGAVSFITVPKLTYPRLPLPPRRLRIAATVPSESRHRSDPQIVRPIANFQPDSWQDHFLNHCQDNQDVHAKKEQEHNLLKDELKRQLLKTIGKPLVYLKLVDAIERLGVAYHFEMMIKETLTQIYHTDRECTQSWSNLDLYHTSLTFRILRQHRYYVSSNVFKTFMDEQGNFLDTIKGDVVSMICLYEAAHIREYGENILEKALEFTKTHLKIIIDTEPNHPLAAQIARALKYPIQKSVNRLECRHFISFYEEDPCHSKSLLRFAKLDFDLLQSIYKEELRELTRWKQNLDLEKKFPFARVRLVEAHFFNIPCYFQPEFSDIRMVCTMTFTMFTILDDIYDAYGILEELEAFTESIEWWDKGRINHLPCYMREYYEMLYDTFEKIEDVLGKLGRVNYINYLRLEVIALCKGYLQEAKWRQAKYVPTYDKYLDNALDSSAIILWLVFSCLLDDEIEKIYRSHKLHRVVCIIVRCMNDMAGYEWDKQRDHVAGVVDCYMKQHGVSEEEAHVAINNDVEDVWKDLAEEIFRPTTWISTPSLKRIHDFCCTCNYIYKYNNAYTSPTQRMKATLTLMLVEPAC